MQIVIYFILEMKKQNLYILEWEIKFFIILKLILINGQLSAALEIFYGFKNNYRKIFLEFTFQVFL